MKIMIASDIHGSAYYLEQLLNRYDEENPDKLLLLGDILYLSLIHILTMSMYMRMEVYTHTSITTMTTVTSIITIMDIIMSTEGFMKSYILLSMQI